MVLTMAKMRAFSTMKISPYTRDKFLGQVLLSDGCWEFTGYKTVDGYGKLSRALAHRFAYAIWVGPLIDGMDVDHLCRNRSCVRPDHIRLATISENRGQSRRSRPACPQGHAYTPENTYVWRVGTRQCYACSRARTARRTAARRLAAA